MAHAEVMRQAARLGEVPQPEGVLRSAAIPESALDAPIETKFYAPTSRKEWVERQDLIQALTAASAKLILVGAPAGFGKTTLIAQWNASPTESRRFAWLSLDSADNDPVRLCWHIVCALERTCPDLQLADVRQALQVRFPDILGTVLPLLLNELAAIDLPVVLALDEYEVISEGTCHDQVEFLLAHLPPSVQIVLMTRSDPPLPLAQLRAAGHLAEIRASQLRLHPAEAAELVRALAEVELGERDLIELVERTEGWPAGLYLAALSLRGQSSPSAYIRQFSGDSRFIVDFLADEVLRSQPDQIRRFLLRTSVLSSFCASLCDAVAGLSNSAEIISILERENLFVRALDDKRQWFRYHRLFAQVLRSELASTEPELIPALHRRASAWHRMSGTADEAISHALAAGDTAIGIDLIAEHWRYYADAGQAATVDGWLRPLGEEEIRARPLAAHCAAWAAALSGDREGVRRWLPVLDASSYLGPLPDGMRSLRTSTALLRGTFGFDGIGPMRDEAALAVTLEANPASPWFALANVTFAAGLYWSGELDSAADYAARALSGPASIALIRMQALAVMAQISAELGNLPPAHEYARAAHGIATDNTMGLRGTPQSSVAHTALGAVLAASGRLQDARAEFEHALRMRRRWTGLSSWPTMEVQLRLGALLADLGDRSGASLLFDEVRQLLTALPDGAGAQLARLERLAGQPKLIASGEPLTEREAAVLRLLRGTLSLREIGEQLYVSQNTVKSHTRAIYRKLGVSTRQEAVAKLRHGSIG